MTPDERKMLQDLADKIAQTPAPPKDPEAEEFIRIRIGNRPDALYLMTQTVLIQNLALEQAQRQIQQLQQSGSQPASGGSFLGQQPRASAPPPPQYAPPQSAYAPPSPSEPPSFLRGAAQTAAGVAAGALAFEGIRSLFSHPGYGYGGLGGFGGFGGGYAPPVEETVVNNYYDDNRQDDMQQQDVQDQYDDNQQFDNVDYDTGDSGGFDDNSGGGDDFV
jgi:hypothetical protein